MRTASVFVLTAGLLLAGCSRSRDHDESFPDTEARLRSASPVVEVAASAGEATFTRIPRLGVDSRGRIYVPDTYQQRVTVLSPEGALLRTIGRRGEGPGEFQAIQSIQVLPGDSILVYDPSLARLSVFAPDSGRPAYTVTLASKLPGTPPWQVQRTRANDALVALFQPLFAFIPGADFSNRRDRVRVLDLDGTIRGEVLDFPARSFLVAGTWITPHPFGRAGFIVLDSSDRLHFVWSDTLGVTTYSVDGSRTGGFQIPYVPPPVSSADADRALAGLGTAETKRFAPLLADSMPARWPAVRDVLIDDRDRIWFALAGSTSEPTEWAAFTPGGRYLGSMLVPVGNEVRLIRSDGTVYAQHLDDNDVPTVVVYEMVRPPR